jgi:hypothetical protein
MPSAHRGTIGSSNGVDSSVGDVHSSRNTNCSFITGEACSSVGATRVAVRIISVAQRVKLVNYLS